MELAEHDGLSQHAPSTANTDVTPRRPVGLLRPGIGRTPHCHLPGWRYYFTLNLPTYSRPPASPSTAEPSHNTAPPQGSTRHYLNHCCGSRSRPNRTEPETNPSRKMLESPANRARPKENRRNTRDTIRDPSRFSRETLQILPLAQSPVGWAGAGANGRRTPVDNS